MIREMIARSLAVLLALSLAVPSGIPAQQAQQPSQAKGGKPAFTPQQLDEMTAPIALYPDALLAQMLTCSQSYFQIKELSEFLNKNSQLKGSAVQDAAQKEGFEASYIALSTFPEVAHMMAQKADWTKKLGQAFTADQQGVFDSIQRLRGFPHSDRAGTIRCGRREELPRERPYDRRLCPGGVARPIRQIGRHVNRDGTLYEKDLGPETDAVVNAMSAYDPGEGWEAVG